MSHRFNFEPIWRPPFVKETAPEDRCHLNGLALVDGRPKYVTCLGESDSPGGWRAKKADGGMIIEVEQNETLLRGLSMPHSPRWHDGALWVLNSGAGELLRINAQTGASQVVCVLPGYLRGLHFVDSNFALVGLSQVREKHIFGALPLQRRFPKLACAVAIVDLAARREVGRLDFTSGIHELYDIAFFAGQRRPTLLNHLKQQTRQAIHTPAFSY